MAGEGSAGRSPGVGTLADEAAQLLDVFAVRLADMKVTAAAASEAASEAAASEAAAGTSTGRFEQPPGTSAPAGHGGACVTWCPVCRSADLLRGDRPEMAGKLLDTALLVVATLRSLIPAPAAGSPGPAAADGDPDGDPPGIQRIDIS